MTLTSLIAENMRRYTPVDNIKISEKFIEFKEYYVSKYKSHLFANEYAHIKTLKWMYQINGDNYVKSDKK